VIGWQFSLVCPEKISVALNEEEQSFQGPVLVPEAQDEISIYGGAQENRPVLCHPQ
jgi:hypothetical protein